MGSEMCIRDRHLIERGYRSFAYVRSQSGSDLRATKRFEAFARVVQEAGARIVEVATADEASSMEVGRSATHRLLNRPEPPRAIYFANDDLAAGGLMHCLAEGLDVPGQVALAGFNGLGFISALPKLITTTVTPRYEIGKSAAAWLMEEQGEDRPTAVELKTELRVGQTT